MPKAFLRCSVGSNEDGTGCFPFSPSFLGFQNGLLMTVNFQGVFIKDCVVRVGEHKPKLSCDGHALCMALQPPCVSSHCCSVNVSFEAAPPRPISEAERRDNIFSHFDFLFYLKKWSISVFNSVCGTYEYIYCFQMSYLLRSAEGGLCWK